MSIKLVEVIRGGLVDCEHWGSYIAVNSKGEILCAGGDTDRVTYFRSSFKPLQALVALEKGAVSRYGLELREIALIVSSHSGEKEHIKVLKDIMRKIGINENQLECGIHDPYGKEALKELYMSGLVPSTLHCNCSGKHMGMIAASQIMGDGVEGYSRLEHELQKEIGIIIRDFCRVEPDKIQKGVDGCGLPVYAVPLYNMALAYANLCDPDFMDGKYLESQNYVISAMTMYPEMVAGKGRFDTDIMKKIGDRFVSKMGAEGVYCAGLTGKRTGIAIKIEDGNSRAIGPVIVELLLKSGAINHDEYDTLKDLRRPSIENHRGEKVGEIRVAF